MNWYTILTPHDTYTAQDVGRQVLLEGGAREASLELQGYLRFQAVHEDDVTLQGVDEGEPPRKSATVKRKRVSRGESAEAGQAEDAAVEPVSGDAVRGEDSSAD